MGAMPPIQKALMLMPFSCQCGVQKTFTKASVDIGKFCPHTGPIWGRAVPLREAQCMLNAYVLPIQASGCSTSQGQQSRA